VLRALERVLAHAFQIEKAVDGLEVLERLAARDDVDVLVTDWVMPYGGLELVRRVRSEYSDVAVVVISGLNRIHQEAFLKQIGCVVLYKPFLVEDLSAAVEQALELRRRRGILEP